VHTHRPLPVAGFAHPTRNVAAFGIQHGYKIADFGAGSGAYTIALSERLENSGTVYAIDVQRDLLRRLHSEAQRRGLKNVEIIWADLEVPRASKLADASIDLVLVSNLLFQVPDKLLVMREARRVVRPSGRVVLIDWSESFGNLGPIKEDVVTKETALELAEKAGLVLEKEFSPGAHHYGLMLKPAL